MEGIETRKVFFGGAFPPPKYTRTRYPDATKAGP
jgi:hypothetical protein